MDAQYCLMMTTELGLKLVRFDINLYNLRMQMRAMITYYAGMYLIIPPTIVEDDYVSLRYKFIEFPDSPKVMEIVFSIGII